MHKDLSTDQLYLYDLCHGLISGNIDESLAARSIGEKILSSWLNTGSAIGRHYASEQKPSKHLIALVKMYAKMWFRIMCHPKAIDAPKHLFEMISIARTFEKEDREVLFKRIQWNAYMAHSEWVLLTMLRESDQSLRQRAVELILRARQIQDLQTAMVLQENSVHDDDIIQEELQRDEVLSNEILLDGLLENDPQEMPNTEGDEMEIEEVEDFPEYEVRKFRVPKLNFEATSYLDMIDLEKELFEPPLTMRLSNDQIQDFSLTPISIPDYSNHMQAVERAVKITTEAASKVVGFEQSHGMICQRIKARKLIPKFHSKKDALPLLEKS